MMSALLGLALALLAADAPGRRIDLGGEATLFVPEGHRPDGDRVDVVLHLHGAPSVAEPALAESGLHAVLIEFNRKGLSGVYKAPFQDPKLLPRLLDAAMGALEREGLAKAPRVGRLVVSSFSAGFGGVREMLKVPEHFERIDALVLADSLYAGYAGDPKGRRVAPDLMAGFARFAGEAAAGRKAMVLSHSAQVPEGYASTTETADFLLRSLGGEASARRVDRGGGLVESRRFARGRFLVLGFEGDGPEDHMRHLRRIAELWRALPGPGS